jgi:hypothetical protein
MLKRLLLGLLAVWAAAGFLHEMNRTVTGYDERGRSDADPWDWRFGSPQQVRLERCVAPALPAIPPRSAVVFVSPDVPPGNAVYRWMWAAYLLPGHDVFQISDPAAPLLAQYVIDCGAGLQHPWLVPLRDLPGGRLYRVHRR